ncbi:MAG: TraM recognition domain-containing protein [Solirubrobacteraceae bacterium]
MSATSKKSGGGSLLDPEAVLFFIVAGVVAVIVGALTAAIHLGAALDGGGQAIPANPFALVADLAKGDLTWPKSATIAMVAILVLLAVIGASGAVVFSRRRKRRSRVDRAASRMGRGRDLAPISRKQAKATAERLGVDSPGLVIAKTVAGGRPLYQGWEDVSVDIWGPRVGKTTSRAIPAILEAPGAVLVTSNKRDVVDATWGPRSTHGDVWPFDPQGIVGASPDWWWNPLTYVTDEVKADILADVFASAGRDPAARTDAYFEPAGQRLLANLLLAAALAKRPLTQVYLWLSDPSEDEPVGVLEEHGYPLLAAALQSVVNAPEKQRGGVYGTAQQIASFMTNREAMRWVTVDGAPAPRSASSSNPWTTSRRREFDPHEFVKTSGTVYSLSKEGRGSAGPIVTALTVAICEAAEEHAKRSPGGRLPVPMVAVLDEAANVCRWRELPNLQSHYGSRGICLMTILQSWSQGVEVWGRDGMRKLWSAANIKVYGGGVSEVEFLSELSQLVGDFDLNTTSVSHGRGGRSTNRAVRRERVLDVADLTALPKGRAVVFASGAPATLVRTLPWMAGPRAGEVRASIAEHDPAAEVTLAEAMDSLSDVQAREETALPA